MSEKTNEEKLKILQERLATIQHKKEKEQQSITEKNKPVAPVFNEELVEKSNIKPSKKEPKEKTNSLKYFIIWE